MTVVDLDYALLRKTSRGDQRAFAELMQRHQDRIYRLAWRLLRQAQEAEDAAQEVFLKAYQNAGRFTPTGTVAAWLNRITANHCLNLLRARKVKKEVAWEDFDSGAGQGRDIAALGSGAQYPFRSGFRPGVCRANPAGPGGITGKSAPGPGIETLRRFFVPGNR